MIWALTFVSSTAAAEAPDFVADLRLPTPALLPWPKGLPDPIDHADGSRTLPPELAQAVLDRLRHYEELSPLCDTALDLQLRVSRVALEGRERAARAEGRAEVLELRASEGTAWSTAELALGVVAGVVVGSVVGLGLGLGAGR